MKDKRDFILCLGVHSFHIFTLYSNHHFIFWEFGVISMLKCYINMFSNYH